MTTHSRHHPSPLPAYQTPTYALSPTALLSLQNFPTAHPPIVLKAHLRAVDFALSRTAAEFNDSYYRRKVSDARRKARRQREAGGEGDGDEGEEDGEKRREREEDTEHMGERVSEMTGLMEEKVRGSVDMQARVEVLEGALGALARGERGAGSQAQTQSTLGASQFRQTGRRREGLEESEDEDQDMEGGGGEGIVGMVGELKRKLGEHEAGYAELSMQNRYASHNSYTDFKKLVHDATHPGSDVPLPHASTWFPADPRDRNDPKISSYKNPRNPQSASRNAAEDSESDVEVTAERISTKCPITQLPMKDPLSSTKCPHSFEKTAILEMIARSTTATDGAAWRRGAERGLKCPVCGVMLTAQTLAPNPILIRKIARLRAAEETQGDEEDLEDEGERMNGIEVNSDDEAPVGGGLRVKSERAISRAASRVTSTPAGKGPPPSSAVGIVDLGNEEERDEDMGGDEEEDDDNDDEGESC